MHSIGAHLVVGALVATFVAACDAERSTAPLSAGPSPTPMPPPTSGPSPTPATVDLTGQYTLTLLASPSCTSVVDGISHQSLPFPSAAQTRSYDAKITQLYNQLEVLFTPAECNGGYYRESGICAPIPARVDCHTTTFPNGGCALGSVRGREMTFDVTPAPATPHCGGGDYWWEQFSTTEVFEACGTWRASIDDTARITGTVDGTFGYLRAPPDRNPSHLWESDLYCRATDHQFTLTKR